MTTLLFISFLLLVLSEVLYDGHFGDKHDEMSAYVLVFILTFAELLGLLIGRIDGVVVYLFIRYALFDAAFGYFFRDGVFYLGEGAWTDRVQKHLPKALRVVLWVVSLSVAILCLS